MHFSKSLPALFIFSTILSGCADNTDNEEVIDSATSAIIVGPTADYSSASLSIIESKTPFSISSELNASSNTDVVVSSFGENFYRIERYGANNITKYHIDNPSVAIWQCSTEGDDTNSNPYQMIHISESKAYVLRYGTGQVWVVNPSIESSANCASDFKIAEIDLSSFDDDGVPDMSSATLVDDRIYISLQRLAFFAPVNDAQVVVIDTTTDTVVDVDDSTSGDQAITIMAKNPGSIFFSTELDKVLVQGVGKYDSTAFGGTPAEYSGGIDSIDPTTFAVTQIVNDTLATTGQISGMSLIDANTAYLIGYSGYQENTLFQFNPATGVINTNGNGALEAIAGLANTNISSITAGPNKTLWLSVSFGVLILDTVTNTILESLVDTQMNPSSMTFISK